MFDTNLPLRQRESHGLTQQEALYKFRTLKPLSSLCRSHTPHYLPLAGSSLNYPLPLRAVFLTLSSHLLCVDTPEDLCRSDPISPQAEARSWKPLLQQIYTCADLLQARRKIEDRSWKSLRPKYTVTTSTSKILVRLHQRPCGCYTEVPASCYIDPVTTSKFSECCSKVPDTRSPCPHRSLVIAAHSSLLRCTQVLLPLHTAPLPPHNATMISCP